MSLLPQVEVQTLNIEPGTPWETGYAESFHGRLRDEFLALKVFESLAAARKLTTAWRNDCNHHRPHGSLGYVAPAEFAESLLYPNNKWYRNSKLVLSTRREQRKSKARRASVANLAGAIRQKRLLDPT